MANDLIFTADTLDGSTIGLGVSTTVRYASAVVPGSSAIQLKRVDMYLGGKAGKGTQTLTLKLLNDAGDTPGSTIVTLDTTNVLESDPVGWLTLYDSATGRELSAGTKYWLVLEIAGGGINTDKFLDDPVQSNVVYASNYARDAAYATLTGSWTDVGSGVGFWYPPFRIYGEEATANVIAHDPTPADTETDVRWDFKSSIAAPITYDGYLSWENDSEPDSYDVYFGTQSGSLTQLITGYTGIDVNSGRWFSPLVQILVTDQESNETPPNGYREVVPGDVLTNPSNSATYTVYRADRGHLVNTNYQYYVYATRVGEPAVDSDILTNGVTPDKENPQAVKLVVTDRFLSGEDAELAYFPNTETTYYWRIDSIWDTPEDLQTGDEWSFTTKEKKYFRNYELVSAGEGGSGLGPEQGGIEGADWKAPNSNIIVAAAGNAIWYEDKI